MKVTTRRYKRGGWEVDIQVETPEGTAIRERKKSPFGSRSASERWAQARALELALNGKKEEKEVCEERKPVPTLAAFEKDFIESYAVANRHKHSSVVSKKSILKNHLVPRLGAKRLDEIGPQDVQALKAGLAHLEPKTVNCILTVLKTMLRVAVDWDLIDTLPVKIAMLRAAAKPMAFYDDDEFDRLVAVAGRLDPRILVMVLLGGDAGMRMGEIIALELGDLDLKRGVVTVRRNEWKGVVSTPKSGRHREVPLTARLAAALTKLRHLRGPRVLYRDDGQTASYKVLKRWMVFAQRAAGLRDNGGLHVLRHSFCSRLAMSGASAKAIQELAGHQSLSTTLRYMHLSPAAREGAIRLLERRCTGDGMETARVEGGQERETPRSL